MVWLLICFGCALDEVLAGLAHRARESSRRVRSPSEDASSYEPGFYDINGISFTLSSRLIGHADASIVGYAATSSVLALLSNPIDADSILVDEEQRLLRIERMFTTDKDVLFYNISVENPLVVFGNLRFRTTPNDATQHNNFNNRSVDDTRKIAEDLPFIKWPSPVEKEWTINWDTKLDRPLETNTDDFGSVIGGKLYAAAWADWQFSGTTYLRVYTGFDVRGQMETGFTVRKGELPLLKEVKVKEKCSELQHKPPGGFVGYEIRGQFFMCASMTLKGVEPTETKGATRQPVMYRRPWTVRAVRSAFFKVSGSIFAQPKIELARLKEVGSGVFPTFELKPNGNYACAFSAQFDLYGKTIFALGGQRWNIKLGVRVSIGWTFSIRQDACANHQVFRKEEFEFVPFFENPAITVARSVLLTADTRYLSGDSLKTSVEGCLFVKGQAQPPTGLAEQPQQKVGVLPSVDFKQGERYGSIQLQELPEGIRLQQGVDVYALVRLDDCTPLLEAQPLSDGVWAIRLVAGLIKGRSFSVKVHRRSDVATKYSGLGVEAVFAGPPELFCRDDSSSFNVVGSFPAGCIPPTSLGRNISKDWDAWLGGATGQKQKVNAVDPFRLQYIGSVEGRDLQSMVMTRNQYILQEDTLLTVLPVNDVEALRTHHSRLLLVDERNTESHFFCNGWSSEVTREGLAMDYWGNSAYAVSHSSGREGVLQIFKMSVDAPSLIVYNSQDGLAQVSGKVTFFHSGFYRQVVGRSEAYVYRNWAGSIDVLRLPNDEQTVLSVRAELENGEWKLSLSLVSGNNNPMKIPWGVKMYSERPSAFFEGFGIKAKKKGDQYQTEEASFTNKGEIIVHKTRYDLSPIRRHEKDILHWLDLGRENILWQIKWEMKKDKGSPWEAWDDGVAEEEVDNGLGADALTLIEVAVGAFVGALIITLVGVLIYRRRLRANEKSSSTVSDRTSSDGICQDGLIETGE